MTTISLTFIDVNGTIDDLVLLMFVKFEENI